MPNIFQIAVMIAVTLIVGIAIGFAGGLFMGDNNIASYVEDVLLSYQGMMEDGC